MPRRCRGRICPASTKRGQADRRGEGSRRMNERKEPVMRRLWLAMALLVAVLAFGAAACGGGDEPAAPAPPAEPAEPAEPPAEPAEPPAETGEPPAETGAAPAGADEYGETYDADPAVIEQALFDATLLPEDPVAEQVAL